jgi:hypothetical protein
MSKSRPGMIERASAVTLGIWLLTCAPVAWAGPQVVVIDADLRTQAGELVELQGSRVALRVQGREAERTGALAVLIDAGEGPGRATRNDRTWPAGRLVVDLVTGERWLADPASAHFEGERLTELGSPLARPVKLDELRALQLLASTVSRAGEPDGPIAGAATAPSEAPGQDRALLRSGDVLSGFVASIEGALNVQFESKGKKTVLTSASWRALTLANPAPPVSQHASVWLAGGERARGALSFGGQGWSLVTGRTGPAWVLVDEHTPIGTLLVPGALRALASLGAPAFAGDSAQADGPTVGAPGALGVADVHLREPGTYRWTLPPGGARVAGEWALRDDCLAYGDCTVTLHAASDAKAAPSGEALLTVRLHAGAPSAGFNVALPPGSGALIAKLDAGPSGPVQDRVVLKGALLRVSDGK